MEERLCVYVLAPRFDITRYHAYYSKTALSPDPQKYIIIQTFEIDGENYEEKAEEWARLLNCGFRLANVLMPEDEPFDK